MAGELLVNLNAHVWPWFSLQEAAANFENKWGKHTTLCSCKPPQMWSELKAFGCRSQMLPMSTLEVNLVWYRLNLNTQLSPLDSGEVIQYTDHDSVPPQFHNRNT